MQTDKELLERVIDLTFTPSVSEEGRILRDVYGYDDVIVELELDERERDLLSLIRAAFTVDSMREMGFDEEFLLEEVGSLSGVADFEIPEELISAWSSLLSKARDVSRKMQGIIDAADELSSLFAAMDGTEKSAEHRLMVGGFIGRQGAILRISAHETEPSCGLAETEEGERIVTTLPLIGTTAEGLLHEWGHGLEMCIEQGAGELIFDKAGHQRLRILRDDVGAAIRGLLDNDSEWIEKTIPWLARAQKMGAGALHLAFEKLSDTERCLLASRMPAFGDLETADRLLRKVEESPLPFGLARASSFIKSQSVKEFAEAAANSVSTKNPSLMSDDERESLLLLAKAQKKALWDGMKTKIEQLIIDKGLSLHEVNAPEDKKAIAILAKTLFSEAAQNARTRGSHETSFAKGVAKMAKKAKELTSSIHNERLADIFSSLDESDISEKSMQAKDKRAGVFTMYRLGRGTKDRTCLFRLSDDFWATTRVERNEEALKKKGAKEGYHPLSASISRRMEGAAFISGEMRWGLGKEGKVSLHAAVMLPFEIGIAKRCQRTCDISSALREEGVVLADAAKIIGSAREALALVPGYLSEGKKGMDPFDPSLWRGRRVLDGKTSVGEKRLRAAIRALGTAAKKHNVEVSSAVLEKALTTLGRGPSRGFANGVYGVIQRAAATIAESRSGRECLAYGLEGAVRFIAQNGGGAKRDVARRIVDKGIVEPVSSEGLEWGVFQPDPKDARSLAEALSGTIRWASQCRRDCGVTLASPEQIDIVALIKETIALRRNRENNHDEPSEGPNP